MATPKKGYFLQDGTKVPGVTTILSRFKNSGALIAWAWRMGTEGKDYREVRDNAANTGTLVHSYVEAFLKNTETDDSIFSEEQKSFAKIAFGAFKKWWEMSDLSLSFGEVPLVSEKLRFGGCPDAILRDQTKWYVGDWKSGGAWPEALCQVAAYRELVLEAYPNAFVLGEFGGYHIVRFDKEHGDFVHRFYSGLKDELEQFLLFRRAYDLDKAIGKRAR